MLSSKYLFALSKIWTILDDNLKETPLVLSVLKRLQHCKFFENQKKNMFRLKTYFEQFRIRGKIFNT